MIPNEGTIKQGQVPAVALSLTGCSTIFQLPLQNSGTYTAAPCELVATALAHVAHLTDVLSSLLHIPLVHPMRVFETFDCLISPRGDQT